jgi:hypothetical protein
MNFDELELYVMAHALLQCTANPEWMEELAVEYDTGDEFWRQLSRKCNRHIDKHG